MRHKKAVWFATGVVLLGLGAAVVFLVYVGLEMNRHIDLCDDPTSGRYIQDPDKRQEVCSQW